ncbi:polyketide cyclase [Elizabethkingia argentiflava]|uniref:Polyketide cyclase n=1 Tax=Elizabethkingia argenteiflava TaxID=2681556 RepID=A0A845PXA1_9FLAO|nr:GyrI-like domain-containing protein [Elizabethkingia argenteiflava]NAW51097.1 polyketide cyclase [Elizabethkingia argenteiflava]
MKWIKLIITFLIIIFGIYAISMLFVEKTKSFSVKKEVHYPLEKVFPQFNNLCNLSRWNKFVQDGESELSFSFYEPYEGTGSSMRFVNKRDSAQRGDLFIRYMMPGSGIKYQLFRNGDSHPYYIDVKFEKLGEDKTEITWFVKTPPTPYLKRSLNLLYEEDFISAIDKSILSLDHVLGSKVDKEKRINSIQYNKIFVEDNQEKLLIGISASTPTRKNGDFYNSVVMNYNQLHTFMIKDLEKKDDEFGDLHLMLNSEGPNNKISYFCGVEVSKTFDINDNNFSFRTIKRGKSISTYYKGDYEGIKKTITNLKEEAKKMEMSTGELVEIFMEPPAENKEVILKITLQIY